MRQKEVCQLRWEWEQRVPELDTPEIKRTVFVLPEWVTKNKEARVVVLSDVAQRIVDELRGQHPTDVFIWEDRKGRRRRFCRLNNSGWKAARRRAAARYQQELGRPAPDGFRRVRVHDLKHTCGRGQDRFVETACLPKMTCALRWTHRKVGVRSCSRTLSRKLCTRPLL
jgi:integrase